MTPDHVNGVILLIVLGLFIAAFYGPWQWYCVDRARQDLFEIRARIFNLAARGELSFDSPEYRSIRENLNKRLRFAHRACWQQMLVLAWAYPKLPSESELTRHIRLIENPSLRKSLEQEADRARRAMTELIMLRSPLLMAGYLLVTYVMPQRDSDDAYQPERRPTGERIAVEAESLGPFLDRHTATPRKTAPAA